MTKNQTKKLKVADLLPLEADHSIDHSIDSLSTPQDPKKEEKNG